MSISGLSMKTSTIIKYFDISLEMSELKNFVSLFSYCVIPNYFLRNNYKRIFPFTGWYCTRTLHVIESLIGPTYHRYTVRYVQRLYFSLFTLGQCVAAVISVVVRL